MKRIMLPTITMVRCNMENNNYFTALNSIDVSKKIEKKQNLSYLSWAWAWGELKKNHHDANYKIYETEQGRIYWDDGKTAWVKVSVTINEIEHIEYLPILDYSNKSIAVENISSFDVNKSIQRGLTKAAARHGLGLYIYAGEDLPEQEEIQEPAETITQEQFQQLQELISTSNKSTEDICNAFKLGSLIQLPQNKFNSVKARLEQCQK